MISPSRSRAKHRNYATYDLEWVPDTYALRLAGMYDGSSYKSFIDIESFLAHALTHKYRGWWFYAHAGGLYDIQWVFEVLLKHPSYSVDASFSGSSAIIVHVKRGKDSWHFIDSLWLLKGTLAEIGKNIGFHKTGPTDDMTDDERKEWYTTVAFEILRDYNRNDCIVLWKAIAEFELTLLELGGQLQMTLASTGLNLFKRQYLKDDIRTSELINTRAVQSYTASRVEVFERECWDARYYDINSSFPYAMTFPVPGSLLHHSRTLSESLLDDDTRPSMAFCKVFVPDCFMPPLPYRMPGKIYFPVGEWRAWFTGIDLRSLLEAGGKILSVGDVLEFEPRWDLKEFAETLYRMRMNSDDKFHREVFKLLLNSSYGKFAERREKRTMVINPSAEKMLSWKRWIDMQNRIHKTRLTLHDFMLRPGVYLFPVIKFIPHRHVPISAYITARARQTLYTHLENARDVHYCDTDGFSTTSVMETSTELGGLKLEKLIDHGEFLIPKLYRLEGREYKKGEWVEGSIVKAKGFSIKRFENKDKIFEQLKKGESITVNRMVRIIENARKGKVIPSDVDVPKRIRLENIGKRYMYPDGQTRPWQIEEIEDMK